MVTREIAPLAKLEKPSELRGLHVTHTNNFDLIRLLAALQVAFGHGVLFLHPGANSNLVPTAMSILWLFPGVPIFFCVSGFLIARSAERNLDILRAYFRARALRIYPALWLCVGVGGLTLWLLGYFHSASGLKVAQWWLLNLAAGGAAVNPNYLRSFGSGVWNGSLWTIAVELSFYGALPVIYLLCRRTRVSINAVFGVLLLISFAVFIVARGLDFGDTKGATIFEKVVWFSLAGNLWMFLFGTLAHRGWTWLGPLVRGRFLFWLAVYLFLCLCLGSWLDPVFKSVPLMAARLLICRATLALLTLSAAYSAVGLGKTLLHGNDISYGLYLFHMLVFNLCIHFGFMGWPAFSTGLGLALVLASLSWFCLESRALALKKTTAVAPAFQR